LYFINQKIVEELGITIPEIESEFCAYAVFLIYLTPTPLLKERGFSPSGKF
jgi:hypothetical protein